MSHRLFVSMPIKDLDRSVAFFTSLGLSFNPRFKSDTAACLLIGDHAYAMLVTEPLFRSFTARQLCDTRTHVEGAFGLSCQTRAAVDDLVTRALASGATEPEPPQEHGFLYGRSFEDLDGHHWEVICMDPPASQLATEELPHDPR